VIKRFLTLSAAVMTGVSAQAENKDTKVIITQAEGYARLLAPVDPNKELIGTRAMKDGKIIQVVEAVPGVEIPSGSTLQTFAGKVKMALPSGDTFVASQATDIGIDVKKKAKGKSELNLDLKKGLMRGAVQKSKDLSINVITDNFKAKMGEAEFITAKLKGADPKSAAKASVIKMVKGSAQLAPLMGLEKQLIDAKAGADVVMGLKSADVVPLLQEQVLMKATELDPKKLIKVPPEVEESLELINNTSAALESKLDQMIEPEDDCGCPSLEERLKRKALKTARDYVKGEKKQDGEKKEGEPESLAKDGETDAQPSDMTPAEGQPENTVAKNNEAMNDPENKEEKEKGLLSEAQELACLSPVLEDLQGAVQIVGMLKDGIFSSKEAKEGSCVSKNSRLKSFLKSRTKLKFPNGDEILSSENVDMALDWGKDKLDVKLNNGSVRGVFDKAGNKTVNLQANGLSAVTKGGDIAMSAQNAVQNLASSAATSAGTAAAGAAISAGGGLLGSVLSGVGGLASGAVGAAGSVASSAAGSAASVGGSAASGASASGTSAGSTSGSASASSKPSVSSGSQASNASSGTQVSNTANGSQAANASSGTQAASTNAAQGANTAGTNASNAAQNSAQQTATNGVTNPASGQASSAQVANSSGSTQSVASGGSQVPAASGPAITVLDGTAKVGNQIVEAGSQITKGAPKPVKLPQEKIKELVKETEPIKDLPKAPKVAARTTPTHPAPYLEGLVIDSRAPEEALIKRYLEPSN
jgi:hypothetical protein